MKINLPWILSRKRLIIAAIADGVLFTFLYYTFFISGALLCGQVSPRLAVLLAIWSLISYVIGRYVSGGEKDSGTHAWDIVGRQIIGTGAVLLLTWCNPASYLVC